MVLGIHSSSCPPGSSCARWVSDSAFPVPSQYWSLVPEGTSANTCHWVPARGQQQCARVHTLSCLWCANTMIFHLNVEVELCFIQLMSATSTEKIPTKYLLLYEHKLVHTLLETAPKMLWKFGTSLSLWLLFKVSILVDRMQQSIYHYHTIKKILSQKFILVYSNKSFHISAFMVLKFRKLCKCLKILFINHLVSPFLSEVQQPTFSAVST